MAKESDFSRKLQEAMLDSGLNQEQLAEKMGIKQQQISMWKRGIRKPSLKSKNDLAKAMGKPLNFFIENSGNTLHGNNNTVGSNNVISYADAEIMRKYIHTLEEKLAAYEVKRKKSKKK